MTGFFVDFEKSTLQKIRAKFPLVEHVGQLGHVLRSDQALKLGGQPHPQANPVDHVLMGVHGQLLLFLTGGRKPINFSGYHQIQSGDSDEGTNRNLIHMKHDLQRITSHAFILLEKSEVTELLNMLWTLSKYTVQISGVISKISFHTALPRKRDNSNLSPPGTKCPLARTSYGKPARAICDKQDDDDDDDDGDDDDDHGDDDDDDVDDDDDGDDDASGDDGDDDHDDDDVVSGDDGDDDHDDDGDGV